MDTSALPRDEWGAFFDDLSRQYEQGLVSVTVRGDGTPETPVFSALPLLGVQLNTKGSDADSITIMAGQDEDTAISHTIADPVRVHVVRTPDGQVSMMEVAAPDPAQTRLHILSSS